MYKRAEQLIAWLKGGYKGEDVVVSVKLKKKKDKNKWVVLAFLAICIMTFILKGMHIDNTPIKSEIGVVDSVEQSGFRSGNKCYTDYDFVITIDNVKYKIRKRVNQDNTSEIATYNKYEHGSEIKLYKRESDNKWRIDLIEAEHNGLMNRLMSYMFIASIVVIVIGVINLSHFKIAVVY